MNEAKPTLLDLYRQDPVAVREKLERQARAERSADVNAFCGRLAAGARDALAGNAPAPSPLRYRGAL